MNQLSLTPLLQDLQRNRISTLQLDRRAVQGFSKGSSSSSLSTLQTYDSETEDETFSSSSSGAMAEDDIEDIFFCWSMLVARIRVASRVENVILHDDVLTRFGLREEHQATAFQQILRSLPHLPNLRQLRIYISRQESLDYALLSQVVQSCHRLESLIICDNLSWDENSDDKAFALTSREQIQNLADAIHCHPSLIEVSLQECFVAPQLSLDPIVQALSTLPRLEMINLTLHNSQIARISDESLRRLFRVEALQDVTLWSVGLDDRHLEALSDILPLHPSLVFLSLRNNSKITPVGWQILCNIVRHNFVLRSLYTDEIVPPDREIFLQNLLYWNQCGRQELLESNDPTIWRETLSKWKDNPTALYYLVREGHSRLFSHARRT